MRRNNPQNANDEGWNWLGIAAGVAGVAAAAGGIYYMATRNGEEETHPHETRWVPTHDPEVDEVFGDDDDDEQPNPGFRTGGGLSSPNFQGNFSSSSVPEGDLIVDETIVKRGEVPDEPYICNLNTLLEDVYKRHVALKEDDFKLYYRVFDRVLNSIHSKMKTVDMYYNRYSSNVQFCGSHYNRIKIKKPDEFDVDIVIRLPVDMEYNQWDRDKSDIIIEPQYPGGFVQLRAGEQYKRIPFRDNPHINKIALSWLDERDYILRSKFYDWFKSVVNRALNTFETRHNLPCVNVDGAVYTIKMSSSGPACTLVIEAPHFKLDVDLVPALKFSERRWPIGKGYRPIPPGCERGYWMAIPKQTKDGRNHFDENRSWRIALQDQERNLFHDTHNMRKVICLIKYYRDVQNMNKIASYYITTLFLTEVIELQKSNPNFWRNNLETCFKHMFNRLHRGLSSHSIEYFWNRNHNLIGNLGPGIWQAYECKVDKMKKALQNTDDYKNVAKCLLSPDTYSWYERHM